MNHQDAIEVHLELEGRTVLVGHAQFHRSRGTLTSTTFQYESTYLAHPRAYALDPALELRSGTLHTPGLPGSLADSAPDRWGRRLITKRETAAARTESRRPQALDDADFLVAVSDITRQGALRFRAEGGSEFLDPGHRVPKLVSLPELLHAADATARDTGDDYAAVQALLDAGTGPLGGARPKAAVLDDAGQQLIAKFPHPDDDWDVMAWEAVSLDLAESARITVPAHSLVRIDGRHLHLLRRFDRSPDGGRTGYMSAMTLLERRDGDGGDYVEIAGQLQTISAQPKRDARELLRRAAFNVGIANTDDHLRNHGFLRQRAGWAICPAFDLNPNPVPGARQTSVAGAERAPDEPDGLMELGRQCGLSASETRSELAEVSAAVEHWHEAARARGVRATEVSRFTESFASGIHALHEAATEPPAVVSLPRKQRKPRANASLS